MKEARSFYRAVNLREDISNPHRLAHYRPTKRSLPVVEAVLGRDPTIVIAAYGSGKSLAAGIGALLVRNDAKSRQALRNFLGHLERVDRELRRRLSRRLDSLDKGRVVILSGHVQDLARDISQSVEAPSGLKTLDQVLKWIDAEMTRPDRLAIIWDEFGRHLESLVAEGRSRDLDHVQRLAEWAARGERPSVSLTLLLHQNLLAYAGALNPTSRNEWRKIEGRFRQLRFVEDSRELYRLVAESIADRRGADGVKSNIPYLDTIVRSSIAAGWFDGAADVEEVTNLVRSAWPLSAGALQALPRLAARVGQSERSLFSFLADADLSKPVGFEELYLAFSDAMRSDVGTGGAHRRWIETESARSKTENVVEREALAAACLLQLGVDGERRKLGLDTLKTAVASRGTDGGKVAEAIGGLIKRKLLLHRRVNDDVSVWHGVDVDIAGRLAEERNRRADDFDVIAFLERRHPAPIVRAMRHNAKFGTTRYLSGRYVTAETLKKLDSSGAVGSGEWGEVLYVLTETPSDISKARNSAKAYDRRRTIVVVPSQPLPIVDVALELGCLESLREDETLVSEDPLVSMEIDELMSVAARQLSIVLHRLTSDRPTEAKWFHGNTTLFVNAERPASIAVSDLMDDWYRDTPSISNDQLMRQRVSRQMNTARVRFLTRLMEGATRPRLGYGENDTSVESSIYRTVLERTGLHREERGIWRFADPKELSDAGLRKVWEQLEVFYTKQSKKPKKLYDIIEILARPRIGVPAGVMPILVMAGYRSFARNVSLRLNGEYVPDILGFDANRMFGEPEHYEIEVHESDEHTLCYLSELAYVFTHEHPGPSDEMLRFAYDAFGRWRLSLPDGARRSRRLSEGAKKLMGAVLDAGEPADFFLQRLPETFGVGLGDYPAVLRAVESARREIDSVVDGYVEEAVAILGAEFRMGDAGDAIAALQSWVACLDIDDLMRRDDLRLTDKAILRTARDTINGRYTPQSLARALSAILLQRGVEQWQDSTGGQYAMLVRECRRRIEDASLACDRPDAKLRPIIRSRIEALQALEARLACPPYGKDARKTAGGDR